MASFFDGPEYQHHNDNQWFGKRVDNKYPRIFVKHVDDGFAGVFGWSDISPDGCLDFVWEQMDRYGLNPTGGLEQLVIFATRTALFHFSHYDPYVFFSRGLSDVRLTDDWQNFAYVLQKKVAGGKTITYEPGSEDIESYALDMAQGERVFREFLKRDFLAYVEALDGVGEGHLATKPDGSPLWITTKQGHPLHDLALALKDTIDSELQGIEIRTIIGNDGEQILRSLCTYRNESGIQVTDVRQMDFYFEFAAWAALVWILSPLSRDWRCDNNNLTQAVHDCGEAILVEYTIFPRGYYTKTSRPVRSCHLCHVQSWCLEEVMKGHTLTLICESCLSAGMPILPPANCGSKLCRMPQCRHHPLFAFDPNLRLHQTMRTAGQLAPGAARNPLLSGQTQGRNLLR